MYPTGQQISFQTTPMNVQDPSTKMLLEPKEENQNGGGSSHAEFALFNSKRLQSDLETMGNKIKHHEDNLKFLQSQKSKLDESIVDLQVLMSKLHSPATPRNENCDNNLHNEDISEQILQHEHSAAGVLGLVQTRHGSQASQLTMTQGVVDIVAKLGKVHDENLSQILSDYLGTRSMLAVVCKNYDSVQALENYDNQGNIDKNGGLHGLGSSIGRTIEGHFDVICLENLRPFVGQHIADDPQRRLDLLKPKLPNGECPPGFLGFAVNMIQIDPAYLLCVTSYGYGLRETLFYSLFSRLQVYKTRVDMISALPCISDGAVSLDGGIIRTAGIFTLGSRDEVNVKFAKPTASRTIDNYNETEKQMKELKWKKEKTLEDIKREQVLREHAVYVFGKKKEEFVRFLAQSSSPIRMTQTKNMNYGLEESPVERQELVSRSRVVYEDATPSEDGVSNSQTVAETNSLNSTESVQETEAMLPMEMYFQHTEYTKKIKISTRCYIMEAVEMLSNLKYPLREEEKRWFHSHPQFKHFFHIHKDKNHKIMGLWMLLVRTVRTEKRKEAWFVVNGIPIRYGITEHALISGLDCQNYPVNYQRMGSMDFVEKQFGKGAKVRYADVKEKLKRMKPSQDRLKMAVLYFLSSIIIGQTKTGEHAPSVEPFFLRVVDDLQICKTFPWGRLSFDHIMREISHTMDHFHGVVKGSQWTMPIFCTPLELLAFEAIPILRNTFREDVPGANSMCPRMCKTKFKRSAMRGFTLDEINETLGNTKDIESILVPSPDEKALVATISEKDNVDDDDDVVIRSWTKRLVDEGRPIFFEEMYNKDVASRADGEPHNAPRPEQLENTPPTGLAVIDGVENVGLVELLVCMKKMDEGFKKLDEKFDVLNRKIVFVEEYVKEQLDARRRYEDMDYGITIHETDLQEKDGEGTLEEKSDKIVEKSPLQEEHRAVDTYMENDEVGDMEGSKDNDEVRDLEEGNAKSGEISPLYEEDQDVVPEMDKNEECQPIEPKIQDEIELQTESEKELVAEQQTEIESLAEPQPEPEKEFIAKSQREPQSHLLQRTFTRKRKRNLSAL